MGIGKRLKEARERAGLTQEELGRLVGVTGSAITNYEKENSHPKEPVMYALMDALGVEPNFLFQDCVRMKKAPSLSDEARRVAARYDSLDIYGRSAVSAVISVAEKRIQAAAQAVEAQLEPKKPKTRIIPLFGNSFAAGIPEPDFGNTWEELEVEAGNAADFAIHIHGDSMEPYLKNGTLAFGRRGRPQDGEVGAFLLDGEFLCKQVCTDVLGNIYLFSLNRSRADADVTIWHDSGRSLTYFGTIIMEQRVPLP